MTPFDSISSCRSGFFGGPVDEAVNSNYWASMSSSYLPSTKTGLVRFTHTRQHDAAVRLGRLTQGHSVLDVGAGTGLLTKRMIEMGCDVVATDASAAMLEPLKRITPSAILSRAEEIDLGRTFDRVFAIGVLNFTTAPADVLARLGRHVRPGGILVIQVTELSFFGLAYWLVYRLKGFTPFLFSRAWLEDTVRVSGFSLLESVHPLPHDLTVSFVRDTQPKSSLNSVDPCHQ